MTTAFSYTVTGQDKKARRGTIHTMRGDIRTPAFMPVGTRGAVKAMTMADVRNTGADIILGNTYHLMLRPGAERIARLGGLHGFIGWRHPILTDSGGFQVMSLAALCKVREHGVTFNSHIDGAVHTLTPERAIEIQYLLGADIQMQLDECLRLPNSAQEMRRAMELSLRWAERSHAAFARHANPSQALFAIVQGGDDPALRAISAKALREFDFHGYAIGGLAVGEPQAVMLDTVRHTVAHLPEQKPRYLMGVGTPDDILKAIALGIDMFDCVLPSRAGRHGTAYTRHGRINLRNARHADDARPLDESSPCALSASVSRAYLHHLIRVREPLGGMLLTQINLHYYQELVQGAAQAIGKGAFADYHDRVREGWRRGDIAVL